MSDSRCRWLTGNPATSRRFCAHVHQPVAGWWEYPQHSQLRSASVMEMSVMERQRPCPSVFLSFPIGILSTNICAVIFLLYMPQFSWSWTEFLKMCIIYKALSSCIFLCIVISLHEHTISIDRWAMYLLLRDVHLLKPSPFYDLLARVSTHCWHGSSKGGFMLRGREFYHSKGCHMGN